MENLVILILGLPLGAAFWAIFLRIFTKVVTKSPLAYGRAFVIMLVVFIINTILSFISGSIVLAITKDQSFPRFDVLIMVFFVQAFIFAKMVKNPESGPIGISKGFLISLYIMLVDIAIVIIFTVLSLFLFGMVFSKLGS
jgi:hypothetical protein